MMTLYLICNPYLEKPFPRITYDWGDGNIRSLSSESTLARVEKEDLQKSLTKHGDWKGLFSMMVSTWGISEITIDFRGSYEDYCDLKEAYTIYAQNHSFSANIIVDMELAKNISPVIRRQILLRQFERWKEISWESELRDVCNTCKDYLTSDSISPTESVVKSKDTMERYLREYLPEEEEEWDRELERLYERRNSCEIKLQISTEQAETGLVQLWNLVSFISDAMIKKLEPMMNTVVEKVDPPQFSKVLELEINGEIGHWIEEEDAFIFMERFRAKALSYYRAIQEQWIKIWKNLLQEMEQIGHDDSTEQYISAFLQKFSACVMEDDPDLQVPICECREEYVVPAYWGQDMFRKSVRNYIDISAYETDLLASVQTQLYENGACWREKLFKLSDMWKDVLTEYSNIIQQILTLENRKHYVCGIRKITKGLTSIDSMLQELEE